MELNSQSGLVTKIATAFRDRLNQWFPPLDPLPQVAPPGTPTRRLDYETGTNVQIQPHLERFLQLRNLADNYDLLRLVIETFKDHMVKLPWSIRVIVPQGEKAKLATAAQKAKITELTALFNSPDGEMTWDIWLRSLIEDALVVDAPTIEPIMSRGGELVALNLVDGTTITPKLGYDGRTPKPPDVAYQQIVKGCPTVEFTRDELIYYPRNRRTHKVYGFSPVEQVVLLANIALRREMYLLTFFTDGSVPEGYVAAPENWTPEQIKEAQDAFDGYLSGNLKNRRKIIIGPGRSSGNPIQLLKPDAVGGDTPLDELMIRYICFAFSISPQALVRMMNRATAKTAKDQASEEGLLPWMIYLGNMMNMILRRYCKVTDLEFTWQDEKEEDATEQANIIKTLVPIGVMTINDARDRLGLDPVEGGDIAMITTTTGIIPVKQAAEGPQEPEMEEESPEGDQALVAPDGKPGAKPPKEAAPKKPKVGEKSGGPAPGSYGTAATDAQRKAKNALRELLEKFLAKQGSKLAKAAAAWATQGKKAADDDEPPFDQAAWTAIVEQIQGLLQVGFREAARIALEAFAANDDALWGRVQPKAVAWADARAAELVTQISDTTRDGLRSLVSRALEEGMSPQELKKAIQQDPLFEPERAERIARTELAKAHVQGTLASWKESGVVGGMRWIVDVAPCPECQENAAAGVVPLGENFPSGDDGPPAHPNCECAISPVLKTEMQEKEDV